MNVRPLHDRVLVRRLEEFDNRNPQLHYYKNLLNKINFAVIPQDSDIEWLHAASYIYKLDRLKIKIVNLQETIESKLENGNVKETFEEKNYAV